MIKWDQPGWCECDGIHRRDSLGLNLQEYPWYVGRKRDQRPPNTKLLRKTTKIHGQLRVRSQRPVYPQGKATMRCAFPSPPSVAHLDVPVYDAVQVHESHGLEE